jgi:predicted alpha/beta superfamily hydrolase
LSTILFHDAQTLPEWNVDAALATLASPPQVLSIPNAGEQRSWEYVGDGLGAHVERVLRAVDGASPPVGIGGSSFGAYASLYAWALHPDVFTRVLAMSPALWVRRERLFDAVARATPSTGTRVWIDVGGRESERGQERYEDGYREMRDLLIARGCTVGGYRDAGAIHHETAWAKRLPEALQFLFQAS